MKGWWLTLRPPDKPASLVKTLQEAGLFPEGETWWFAWNATEIRLPGILDDPADVEGAWETVRVFSSRAELRFGRWGGKSGCWLLLEEDPQEALKDVPGLEVLSEVTPLVENGVRVFWGKKLHRPDGTPFRGEVIFPRVLNYSLPDENLEEAWVADVMLYYDDEHRLQTVRYARLRQERPGAMRVKPLVSPKEVMGLEN
jgi:hypothetical protein